MNHTDTALTILNTAACTPVALAFTICGEDDIASISHNLMKFLADVLNATPYDNLIVALVRIDLTTAVSIVLPAKAF